MKLQFLHTRKVRGAALYISIIVSIVIGILLSMLLLISRYNRIQLSSLEQDAQLYLNLESGFQMARSDYFSDNLNDKWIKTGRNKDSVKIRSCFWGAYRMINVTTKNKRDLLSKSGLFGTFSSSDTALFVPENARPVGVCGKINLKGYCYLPSAALKPMSIEGQNYISGSTNQMNLKPASAALPLIDEIFKEQIISLKKNFDLGNDSLIDNLPDEMDRSFSRTTVSAQVRSGTIGNKNLLNNIKVISAGDLLIDNSNRLENILIIAKKVKFGKGFKGTVHVIASDSIIIESGCELFYPSSLVLMGEDDAISKCISFVGKSTFSGGIVAFNDEGGNKSSVMVKLHPESTVNGLVFTSGFAQAQGTVNGTLLCKTLITKTASSVYENTMMDCEIDPHRYAQALCFPSIFDRRARLVCAKML